MPSASAPQAVLFDIDGTLVDTVDLHAAAWREAFLNFGLDKPIEDIRWQVGKGGDNLLPTLFPELSEAQGEELSAFRGDLFKRDYLPRTLPFPCVRELFETIVAGGAKVVLASSAGEEEVRFHLGLLACEDLVAATTSKDDVERSKPCPDIFEAALAKAGVSPDEAVVVGDSPWDVKAAARIPVRAIGFRSGGFPDEALTESGAEEIYDGACDLLGRFGTSVLGRG
jgi:phosphoglycolate phosphatase-like HAD superfamily hydrolase